MNESLSQSAFRAVRWTTLNTFCQVGVHFLGLIILGRLLSPAAFGLMAMIMVVVEILNVFARMGLTEAIIYKKDVTQEELSSLYFLNILVGLALFMLAYLSSDLIGRFYSEPAIVPLVKIVASLFFITSTGIIFEIMLRKHLLFDTFSKINMLTQFCTLVFMVLLAFWGAGVYALVLGLVFLYTMRSVLLIFIGIRNKWLPSPRFRPSEITFYLKFSIYRVLGNSVNQLNSRVDQILIGAMLGPVVLGFYDVAFRIIYAPIHQMNPILTQVAFPLFSKIQDDTPRLKRNYLKYINLIISINAPLLAGITVLAPILIPLLLGNKWNPAVPIIQALCVYVFLRSIFNASGSLVFAKGKASWDFWGNMVILLFVPATTYFAIRLSNSVIVVAIGLSAGYFLYFFFHYLFYLRRLLGDCFIEYVKAICRPFILASSMGIFTYLLSLSLRGWSNSISAPVLILFGVGYYSVMTICYNPLFVNELEQVLPGKMGKAVGRFRSLYASRKDLLKQF